MCNKCHYNHVSKVHTEPNIELAGDELDYVKILGDILLFSFLVILATIIIYCATGGTVAELKTF